MSVRLLYCLMTNGKFAKDYFKQHNVEKEKLEELNLQKSDIGKIEIFMNELAYISF